MNKVIGNCVKCKKEVTEEEQFETEKLEIKELAFLEIQTLEAYKYLGIKETDDGYEDYICCTPCMAKAIEHSKITISSNKRE